MSHPLGLQANQIELSRYTTLKTDSRDFPKATESESMSQTRDSPWVQ